MDTEPILLAALLRERKWHRYGMFCAEYAKAARKVDSDLLGSCPSRAQLHRWVSGQLKSLPYVDHCRVLEAMFPGWTAEQLFGPCPSDMLTTADSTPSFRTDNIDTQQAQAGSSGQIKGEDMSDVTAVFASRSEFASAMPPYLLFDDASEIRAAGLSLNLLCQQYPDHRLRSLIEKGTTLQCLFLDPDGSAIKAREREEGHPEGHLSILTRLNIQVLLRLRGQLSPRAQDRLEIATYDETVRFNIILINGVTCVMQPYLPQSRGIDSPTFMITRGPHGTGLFPTFEQIFTALGERSTPQ